MHLEPIVLILFQIAIVIGLSRLVGLGFRRIKQPLVIGEIIAGIMLGPSLLGLIAPDVMNTLFPASTLPALSVLKDIGLIFFMFLIGLELDPKYLKGSLKTAVLVSHTSIVVPFALGTVLAVLLYPQVSNAGVSFTAFALFLGAAMSITAFPVLARIITESNLQETRLGALALTCAAVDDVTAWCILALAISVAHTNQMSAALPTIAAAVGYIAFMLIVGRPILRQFSQAYERTGKLSQSMLAVIYICVVVSALITEIIGIHLIFGAFLLGAVMPKHEGLTRDLAQKTEDFVLIFLLPIFFAYSGLKTQIGLLNRLDLWGLCALVLVVAIVGKFVGTYAAARISAMPRREAAALGWMMNTRGLTELIVLNIGLSLGVITPLLFTMLVMMALVTTFMTSPLLEWTYPKQLIRESAPSDAGLPDYRVLVPVANPATQKGLLELAMAIGLGSPAAVVHPLSLIQLDEDYFFESMPLEASRRIAHRQAQLQSLVANLEPAHQRSQVRPLVQVTRDVAATTAEMVAADAPDLLLMGWHRPAFSSNRLGGRVGQILSAVPVDVGVFVERSPIGQVDRPLQRILLPYVPNVHTDLGLELALRLMLNGDDRQLTILRVSAIDFGYEFRQLLDQVPQRVRDRITLPVVETERPIGAVIEASNQADLTIAGASREWGIERQTLGRYTDELAVACRSSLLITRRYSRTAAHLTNLVMEAEV
jgi:Kef-type K+ transport system membrane component KefB/nucleotide-binding universal stress UspA family protein